MGLLDLSAKPDCATLAPPGSYLTDGDQLVRVVESDRLGALAEDCVSEELMDISPDQLAGAEPHWRRVEPAEDAP